MEKTELFGILDTLKDLEESHRTLDEFVDSHSECIGTIRRYLLEGIRKYVFGINDSEECLNTLKSINSSLKGLCCNFGHISFPLSGLEQLFYRILTKIFAIEFQFEPITCLKTKHELLNTGDNRCPEMVEHCAELLCTILKLLSAGNIHLSRDFVDDTLRSIHFLNNITVKGEAEKDIVIHEIYNTFVHRLTYSSGWSNGNEAPVTLKFPNSYVWSQFVLEKITVNLFKTNGSCFEHSLLRDRFIHAWLIIFISAVNKNKHELLRIHLSAIKVLTNDFELRIDSFSFNLIYKMKVIEVLYCDILSTKSSFQGFLSGRHSNIQLIGDFTMWYFDGFNKRLPLIDNFIFQANKTSYYNQLEKAFSFWVEMLNFCSCDIIGEYYSYLVYSILNKMSLYTDNVVIQIEDKLKKELFNTNISNVGIGFNYPVMKSRLLVFILKFIDVQSLILKTESNIPSIPNNSIHSQTFGIFELFSTEIQESNSSIFVANIQMAISMYLTSENLCSEHIYTSVLYTLSTTFVLIEDLIKLNFGCNFELGSYLINHLCRMIYECEEDITMWGVSQCIILSELSIRILVKCKDRLDSLILSLLDLVGKKCKFDSMILNCILNLLLITCIHSNGIDGFLLKRIFNEILKSSFQDSSGILARILKPISIITLKHADEEKCNLIITETEALMKVFEPNSESFFPFGSSFDSLSQYYNSKRLWKNINLNREISFLPTLPICSKCNMNLTSIPSNWIIVCNNCFSIVMTSVDIDRSVFIPELKSYLSTIDISIRYKNKEDIDEELTKQLIDMFLNTKINTVSDKYDLFSSISVSLRLSQKTVKNITPEKFEFLHLGTFRNSEYITYSYYKLLLLFSSRQFIWMDHNLRMKADLLKSELSVPPPVVITNLTRQITDPETNILSNYENLLRLSLLLAPKQNNTSKLAQNSSRISEMLSYIFLGNNSELNNVLSQLETTNIEGIFAFDDDQKSSILNILNISKSRIKLLREIPGMHHFVNIDFDIWNIMFLTMSFGENILSRLFSVLIQILIRSNAGIEENWKHSWSREDLTEFLRGIIPGKKYNTTNNQFKGNSNVIYKILTIISAILMTQNTTLSSISISPGLKRFISIKYSLQINFKSYQHPNSLITLFGPSFTYVLPNLLYKSLVELDSNANILNYVREFIPTAVSHDKIVTLLPYLFLSILENSELNNYRIGSFSELLSYFKEKKEVLYSNLLQIDATDDLDLPRALINTTIAALFWSETNLDNIIYYKYNMLAGEEGKFESFPRFEIDRISTKFNDDKIFTNQFIYLLSKITVLFTEFNDVPDESRSRLKKIRVSVNSSCEPNNRNDVEGYIGKNLMWFLEFYSKTIFLDKSTNSVNIVQHLLFPISFIISEPPEISRCSMYWYRVFRLISLLLFFSRKHIKKHATRLLELLIKLTYTSGMHPSSIESWEIYMYYLLDENKNINLEKNIFLQLFPSIIDQVYTMIESHKNSSFRIYFEKFLEKIIIKTLKTNHLYFVLVPVIPKRTGNSLKKIIVKNYYASKKMTAQESELDNVELDYYRLIIATFRQRIDFTLQFLSPNVPHITYEKLLGSIKDIITMFPKSSYLSLYGEREINENDLSRIFLLFEKCIDIISNASNDSLLIFQKQNLFDTRNSEFKKSSDTLSRYNLIKLCFKKNTSLSDIYVNRKVNYSIEKSISSIKSIIAGIIGFIGSIDINVHNYLQKTNTPVNCKTNDKITSKDSIILFPSISKSIFLKRMDIIAIELIENHLITYSHWNVAAYAIQETLKYIGCHNSISCDDKFKNWCKFQPEVQDILQPYVSTEYRIIQGTKNHLLDQIRNINASAENVYEFYFWCLDLINEELCKLKRSNKSVKIPNSILNIDILLEGCRLVSLGVPHVLNTILLISIECMILFFDNSKVRMLKEKLCSLVVSCLRNNETCKKNKNRQIDNSFPNSFLFRDVTYESIFILITHLIELYEHLIQSEIPETLTWFNESLLEPFLQELYSNEVLRVEKLNSEADDNADLSSTRTVSPRSSTTLSLLAEATKIECSKPSLEKHTESGQLFSDNELKRYIYNQTVEKTLHNDIICNNQISNNFNPGIKLLSTLSNYPILKIIANLQFITDIPISLLVQAALSCRTYTRALLLFERLLLTKQLINENSKKKRINNRKNPSFMSQFGLRIDYSGNIIDYLSTTGFTNIHFDPLNPLDFYRTSLKTYTDLPHISDYEKKKLTTHILYLPYQCYLGINDIENLLGVMSIFEQISAASEGTIGKQLIESLLRKDYLRAAMIYEDILLNDPYKNIVITKCYLRCLLKAGLPKIVLNTLLQSRNVQILDTSIPKSKQNNGIFECFETQRCSIITNHSLFISEALEACYSLGSWEYLDLFLSDSNNIDNNSLYTQSDLEDSSHLDFFIPPKIDLITQKFDVYYGKLLLHLYFLRNKTEINLQRDKMCELFNISLEKARNLLFTQNNIFWKDSHIISSTILEKLHILMDVEYTYHFLFTDIDNELQRECVPNAPVSLERPLWFSISELFVNRVDNAQTNYYKKHSILSHAKLVLEISGFDMASLSILLVIEKSKIHFLHKSMSYINFLDSFEIVENGSFMSNHNSVFVSNKASSSMGLMDFNLNKLFLPSFDESVPGIIQINKSITINYFEHILGMKTNTNISWTVIERKLLDEWESTNRSIYITLLNRSLIVTYLFKLFQTNQLRKAIHLYELINNTTILIDNKTLSEINLIYLDWAVKSSTVSPEIIIKIFQKTIEHRSNCEKTYFQFANYLDNYFHLIISNVESEGNIKTNSTIGNNLGSLIKCDDIIFLCIIMYLNCLKCGNMFIYPSLSRILFLIFNHSNILLKLSALVQPQKNEHNLIDEKVNPFPESLSKIRRELFTLHPSLWYIVLPQLLSRSQHPGLGSFIIQPLVARIIRALPRQAGWFFVSMLKSNSVDRKNTAFDILRISKTLNEEKEIYQVIDGNCCSSIIDEYTRLFDNLSVLAMDMSVGTNASTLSRGQKSSKNINKSMSLRIDFQSLYHSMKNMNKSKCMIIPTQKQLRSNFFPANQTKNVLFSRFLPSIDEDNDHKIDKAFLSSLSTLNMKDEFSDTVSICGIEDNIIILPSKQKPKKIGLIGSDGEIYHYLVKNEKRGDLRKDMRLMELAQLINESMSINLKELSLKTFSVIPLSEVTGIIEWVPNVTTLGTIVMNEWKELFGSSKFHRQLMETQDIFRQNSMHPEKLYKLYCEEILPKYPPILHNWFFKKFSTKSSYAWLHARQKYTRSVAVWSMFGYVVGLGDRHAENILVDTNSGDIVHVDFDCLFGKGFLLEVPEIVPFRLTPNIVIAMGSCGVEGTFTGACISAMSTFRSPFNKSFIMTFLEAFIHDPLIEWMRPGKTSQVANVTGVADSVSFIAAAKGHSHLRTIQRKLNGMIDCSPQSGKQIVEMYKANGSQRRSLHERGLGLSVESQVYELISSAKCKRNLSQMYVGWMPQL